MFVYQRFIYYDNRFIVINSKSKSIYFLMYTLPSRPFQNGRGVRQTRIWRNRKNTFTFLALFLSFGLFRCAINYTFIQGVITFDLSKIHNHKCLVLSLTRRERPT